MKKSTGMLLNIFKKENNRHFFQYKIKKSTHLSMSALLELLARGSTDSCQELPLPSLRGFFGFRQGFDDLKTLQVETEAMCLSIFSSRAGNDIVLKNLLVFHSDEQLAVMDVFANCADDVFHVMIPPFLVTI